MNPTPILTASDAKRIAAIGARLSSDHDGEVVNAGRALVRQLGKHNLRIGDVLEGALAPRPAPRQHRRPRHSAHPGHEAIVRECLAGTVTAWERGFLTDIQGRATLSPKQVSVLHEILEKVRRQPATGGGRG